MWIAKGKHSGRHQCFWKNLGSKVDRVGRIFARKNGWTYEVLFVGLWTSGKHMLTRAIYQILLLMMCLKKLINHPEVAFIIVDGKNKVKVSKSTLYLLL